MSATSPKGEDRGTMQPHLYRLCVTFIKTRIDVVHLAWYIPWGNTDVTLCDLFTSKLVDTSKRTGVHIELRSTERPVSCLLCLVAEPTLAPPGLRGA